MGNKTLVFSETHIGKKNTKAGLEINLKKCCVERTKVAKYDGQLMWESEKKITILIISLKNKLLVSTTS